MVNTSEAVARHVKNLNVKRYLCKMYMQFKKAWSWRNYKQPLSSHKVSKLRTRPVNCNFHWPCQSSTRYCGQQLESQNINTESLFCVGIFYFEVPGACDPERCQFVEMNSYFSTCIKCQAVKFNLALLLKRRIGGMHDTDFGHKMPKTNRADNAGLEQFYKTTLGVQN